MGNVANACHADDEARMRRPFRDKSFVPTAKRIELAPSAGDNAAPKPPCDEAKPIAPIVEDKMKWPHVNMDILHREHMELLKKAGLELSSWKLGLTAEDTLLVVDMQNDFISGKFAPYGGRAAVPEGESTIDPVVQLIEAFSRRGGLIVATREYHPSDHCSFYDQGGGLPAHCVQGTAGSFFYPDVGQALHRAYILPTRSVKDGLPGRPGRVEIAFKGFFESVDSPGAFKYEQEYFQQRLRHSKWELGTSSGSSTSSNASIWTGAMALKCSNLLNDINACPDLSALLQKDWRPLDEVVPRSGRLLVVGLSLDTNVLDTVVNAAQLGYERIFVAADACRPQHFGMSGEYGSGFFTDPAFIASMFEQHNIRLVQSGEVLRTSGVLGGG